jgi:hypothetical protein
MGQTAKDHHHLQRKPPFVLFLTPMILIRLHTPCISFNNILKHKLPFFKWCLPISCPTIVQALSIFTTRN